MKLKKQKGLDPKLNFNIYLKNVKEDKYYIQKIK